MLARFQRIVLIEERKDLTEHHASRLISHILCHADETNASLLEVACVQPELDLVAKEPAERVNNDYVERNFTVKRGVHHLLKPGPFVISAGSGILELVGDDPAPCGTELSKATTLVRNRQIFLGLRASRHPHVERSA